MGIFPSRLNRLVDALRVRFREFEPRRLSQANPGLAITMRPSKAATTDLASTHVFNRSDLLNRRVRLLAGSMLSGTALSGGALRGLTGDQATATGANNAPSSRS